jgi:protease-4
MRRHPLIWGVVLMLILAVGLAALVRLSGLVANPKSSLSFRPKVGVVSVEGIITDSIDVVEQLEEFGRDDRIRSVVVRIESPGGGVVASQEIHDAILELKKKKRVVASMGSVAASGGYLVACAADWIMASPGTITGSLSAIMHYANVEGLLNKVGLKTFVIKSGRFKDIGSPTREMTEEEKALLQSVVDDSYSQFQDIILKNRKIPPDRLEGLMDGRIFTGRQAQQVGLVDEIGGYRQAVRKAGRLAGLKEEPEIVTPSEKRTGVWDYVRSSLVSAFPGAGLSQTRGASGLYYLYLP